MKGSVVVLVGCFALFFAAPSHSYSVKFISENDEVANRRDTQSGSPSPDVATTGDAVQKSDTSAGESETIKTDGDTKPGDESVPGDTQTGKSNIRKRDTRRLVRDMMDNMDNVMSMPVTRQNALYLLKRVRHRGNSCFKEVLKFFEEHEMKGKEVQFTRLDMIRWLNIIQSAMSKCFRDMTEPLVNVSKPFYDDDDTRNSARQHPESRPFIVSELLQWFGHVGKTLDTGLKDAILILEDATKYPNNPVRRSSKTIADVLEELMQNLLKSDGGAFADGEPPQMYPPGQSLPPYPDAIPVTTTYKKSNFLDKPRGYRHHTNLPALLCEYPPFGYIEETLDSILPQASGFRAEAEQLPYTPGITTLPEDVNALPPNSPFSLLQIVLDQINSRLQGTVPPAGNTQTPPAESLRDDANGVSGLYRGFSNGQSPAMEIPGILDTDLLECLKDCMNKKAH